jgi:hypothetical protein
MTSALKASTSSCAKASAYLKSSPSGLPFSFCLCRTDTSTCSGHQSWFFFGALDLGCGDSMTGFSDSL